MPVERVTDSMFIAGGLFSLASAISYLSLSIGILSAVWLVGLLISMRRARPLDAPAPRWLSGMTDSQRAMLFFCFAVSALVVAWILVRIGMSFWA